MLNTVFGINVLDTLFDHSVLQKDLLHSVLERSRRQRKVWRHRQWQQCYDGRSSDGFNQMSPLGFKREFGTCLHQSLQVHGVETKVVLQFGHKIVAGTLRVNIDLCKTQFLIQASHLDIISQCVD